MNLLKISFLLFFIIPTAILANDDYLSIHYFDLNNYKVGTITTQFDSLFDAKEDKNNFKKLREFLNEKYDLENYIVVEMEDFHSYKLREGIENYDQIISKLNKKIKKARKDSIKLNTNEYKKYFENQNYGHWESSNEEEPIFLSKAEVEERITLLEEKITKCRKIEKQLYDNLKNVRNDIYKCQNQIDYTLVPEYKRQEFRTNISWYFSWLMALLIGAFFLVVYSKSNKYSSRVLLNSNGLQFITLFVLIIAIILFGILGILEGRELAAILSGISGYILGKGITPPATIPPATPTTTVPAVPPPTAKP